MQPYVKRSPAGSSTEIDQLYPLISLIVFTQLRRMIVAQIGTGTITHDLEVQVGDSIITYWFHILSIEARMRNHTDPENLSHQGKNLWLGVCLVCG